MQAGTPCAKYAALVPVLTERSLRVWAATEARAIGYGGIAHVATIVSLIGATRSRSRSGLRIRSELDR
jgi:hypothetical protein